MGLTVKIDGADNAFLSEHLQSLTITDSEETTADNCELTLAVGGQNIALPRQGAKMTFARDGVNVGGAFAVNLISGSNRGGILKITGVAYDHKTDLRSAAAQSYTGKTLGEIADEIAGRFGLISAVSDQLGGVIPANAIQNAESYTAFLKRVSDASGGKFQIKDGRLLILTADDFKTASGQTLPSVSFDATDPDTDISFEVTERRTRKIAVRYFDTDGTTIKAVTVGEGETTETASNIEANEEEARRAARKHIVKLSPDSQRLRISTQLRLDIVAGQRLSVSNLPTGVEESFKIIQISHFFSSTEPEKSQINALFLAG